MNKHQLEITLPAAPCVRTRAPRRRATPAARAQWWFERMRRAVDAAARTAAPVPARQDPLPDRRAA